MKSQMGTVVVMATALLVNRDSICYIFLKDGSPILEKLK